METKTDNNHIIPNMILKHYGDRINIYNIQENKHYEGKKRSKSYRIKHAYSQLLEDKLNDNVETKLNEIITKKIDCDTEDITLSLDELIIVKRYMATMIVRSYYDEVRIDNLYQNIKKLKMLNEYNFIINRDEYINKVDSKTYMEKTLLALLDYDGDCNSVKYNVNFTILSYIIIIIVHGGYTSFWKSPKGKEFVICDNCFTQEFEKQNAYDKVEEDMCMKLSFANEFKDKADSNFKLYVKNKIDTYNFFFSNFFMFPLAKDKCFVLIHPLFKDMQTCDLSDFFPAILLFTSNINNPELFKPNTTSSVTYVDSNGVGYRNRHNQYTYKVLELSNDDYFYCNWLFIENTYNQLGYFSIDGVKESIEYYKTHTKGFNKVEKFME